MNTAKVIEAFMAICAAGILLGLAVLIWVFIFGAISEQMAKYELTYQECGYPCAPGEK